jgi:hypothetical protein
VCLYSHLPASDERFDDDVVIVLLTTATSTLASILTLNSNEMPGCQHLLSLLDLHSTSPFSVFLFRSFRANNSDVRCVRCCWLVVRRQLFCPPTCLFGEPRRAVLGSTVVVIIHFDWRKRLSEEPLCASAEGLPKERR